MIEKSFKITCKQRFDGSEIWEINILFQFSFFNFTMGSYQSGQLGLTVTQLSFDFGGSNPSLPTILMCQCYNVPICQLDNVPIC